MFEDGCFDPSKPVVDLHQLTVGEAYTSQGVLHDLTDKGGVSDAAFPGKILQSINDDSRQT